MSHFIFIHLHGIGISFSVEWKENLTGNSLINLIEASAFRPYFDYAMISRIVILIISQISILEEKKIEYYYVISMVLSIEIFMIKN